MKVFRFTSFLPQPNTNMAQVYITSLEGIVPVDITKTFNAFLDFCYIARKSTLTEEDLDALDIALRRFHHYRVIFLETGVRPEGFSLPRQHALIHYRNHIQNFGAPNGLCSSITESKHIKAVKKPWRRSNRYNALQQILMINTRNDNLAAARVDFLSRGMLEGTCLYEALQVLSHNQDDDVDEGSASDSDLDEQNLDSSSARERGLDEDDFSGPVEGPPIIGEVLLGLKKGMHVYEPPSAETNAPTASKYPTTLRELGQHVDQWNLEDLVCEFLFHQVNSQETPLPPVHSIRWLTAGITHLSVFHSANATFCAPNNPSGTGGMYRETIRSTPRWKSGGSASPRRNCVFLNNGSDEPGVRGSDVAQVHMFFSFSTEEQVYPCALVHNFHLTFTDPDPDNGMWVVEPTYNENGARFMSVVHVDSIIRAAHLLPVFQGSATLPPQLTFSQTLDSFRAFYINKYIDYHAFETIF